jgi:hypothetical protein
LVKEEVRRMPKYARTLYGEELKRTGNQFFALNMARAEVARQEGLVRKPVKRFINLEKEERP